MLRSSYSEHLVAKMNAYRRSETFCDVRLVIEGKIFAAHKVVLVAGSPYFDRLFTSEMKEMREEEIELKEIKAKGMENVLEYLYTGKTKISLGNAEDIAALSNYFLIDNLMKQACSFLYSSLTVENCLRIDDFAEKYNVERLNDASTEFIKEHFVEVIDVEDFVKIEVGKFEKLIADWNTVVEREEQIYEAIKKWVNANFDSREKYFEQLFKHVRFAQLSREFLDNTVLRDERVTGNAACMLIVSQEMGGAKSLSVVANQRPRKCLDDCCDAIVISGGKDNENFLMQSTFCLVPEIESWYELAPLSPERHGNALVSCDGFLYSVGGWLEGFFYHYTQYGRRLAYMEESPVLDVEKFDPKTNSWCKVTRLPKGYSSRTATLDGCLYVTIEDMNDYIYRYDPSTDIWTDIALTSDVQINGACLVSDWSELYFIGGRNENREVQNTCHKFDPKTGKCTALAPMKVHRSRASAVYSRNRIFVVGGFQPQELERLNSCEVYSIVCNEWESIASLNIPRVNAAITCIWDDIYVLGGDTDIYTYVESTMAIEHYNEEQGKWELSHLALPFRHHFTCSWARIPEYLFPTFRFAGDQSFPG